MTRPDPAKLLGGHATGTLTEAERKALFAAALEDQALFDALMDEEALRELLADPQAKARVLAALAAPARPKVVPLWRRPGVLGAAAGVLMASLAGLTWLRNPQVPPPARQEQPSPKVLAQPEAAKAPEPPAEPRAATRKSAPRPAAEPPAAVPMSVPTPAAIPADRERRMEKAAPPPPAPGGVPGGVVGGVAGGVVGGAAGPPQAPARAQAQDQAQPGTPALAPAPAPQPVPVIRDQAQEAAGAAPGRPVAQAVVEVLSTASRAPSPARAKAAKAEGQLSAAPAPPTWTLAPQADGTTLVTVTAPPEAQVWLLRRGAGGVEVLQDRAAASKEVREAPRRYQVRLRAGDALDLYVLAHPVEDPAKLPETGPLAGFRARIFPAEK